MCILRDLILLLDYALVEQIFDFVVNHYILVSMFVFLLVAFVINEGKQGGAAITPSNLVTLVNREGAVLVDIRDTKNTVPDTLQAQ